MKMNLKSALLSLVTLAALNTNAMSAPDRAICPTMPAPILKLTVGAGLAPSGVYLREISLLSTGDVTIVEHSRGTNDEEPSIRREIESQWFESQEVMAKIYAALGQVKKAELFDTNPSEPMRMDGLYMSVKANINGEWVEIAKSYGGHIFLPRNATQARAAKYLYRDMEELYKAIVTAQN